MLHLIGLGLNEKSISKEALEVIKKCEKIYLEGYTVDFPYSIKDLEKELEKKIIVLKRENVENEKLVLEAKKQKICLLVYGSPLFATTHVSLLMDCKKNKVKYNILYNASIFDAIAETGLELYKFGKISSMPKWLKGYEPDSFLEYIEENKKINSHSLLLIDIGLEFDKALEQLEKSCKKRKFNIDKIVVCSEMGNKNKILYGSLNKLKSKKVKSPYCFIIPGKMHFIEKEFLEVFQ